VIIAGFDWDRGNLGKCQKHGVSVSEIESLFYSEHRIAPDIKHSSAAEPRLLAIGRSVSGRALFVAFTTRIRGEQTLIRPISARYMHAKEI
jgi:uncharacterized protein